MSNMLQIAHYRPEGEAGAAVVSHVVNKGYGAAIRTCFNYAKENNFDVLITLDGDEQHDPSYIPDFITAMKTNDADVVIGSRNRKCGMQIKVQSL